jgi:hypothetical protein
MRIQVARKTTGSPWRPAPWLLFLLALLFAVTAITAVLIGKSYRAAAVMGFLFVFTLNKALREDGAIVAAIRALRKEQVALGDDDPIVVAVHEREARPAGLPPSEPQRAALSL